MKRFFSVFSLVSVAMMALSCYDDAEIREKIDSLETQLTELTSKVNSVSTIVTALEKNNYIKAVNEITGGYEIEFTQGETIVIKDGKDGENAPEIGATKDVDGIYYWTLDGEWLLDATGSKIPAGMGQPKLKTENGQWYISADGQDWALIGPDVACTIKNVAVTEDVVTFTLADGTEIAIPVIKALDVTFSIAEESAYEGETLTFDYTITGGTEKNRIAVMSSNLTATVTPVDAATGTITVGPLLGEDYDAIVFVTDGVSRTIFKTLRFCQGVFSIESEEVYVGDRKSVV